MLAWAAAAIGAVIGIFQAKRRGGKPLDMAQYAGVYAMIFGIIGVIVQLIIIRSGGAG